MNAIFGVMESFAVIVPVGVEKYKVKMRPGMYAMFYLKYPDRMECWIAGKDELGFVIPAQLMATNKRG